MSKLNCKGYSSLVESAQNAGWGGRNSQVAGLLMGC
jgi:hypothetical protein